MDILSRIRSACFITAVLSTTSLLAAEPADTFSRANCFNNESITYNYWDPPEWRFVVSAHFDTENGHAMHWVSPNPIAWCDSYYGCYHYLTQATRHAAVHGAFASTEPNPDGALVPGVTTRWLVNGYHVTHTPGVGSIEQWTAASDCNLHPEQFY